MRHLAYFVSPHGFGHAARACAVMEALHQRHPAAYHFDIFTLVPEWFFADSLTAPYTYHALRTDVGLVQTSPLHEDLPATLRQLDDFLRFDDGRLLPFVNLLSARDCALIVSDISPLGLAVARALGHPSMLIENFTWDWIYQPYLTDYPAFQPHIQTLRTLFASATYHIQTDPVCNLKHPERSREAAQSKDAPSTYLLTHPVARAPRQSPSLIRQRLGLGLTDKIVFLTMGGIPIEYNFLHHLRAHPHIHFLIPVPNLGTPQREHNVTLLPFRTDYYHPDLIRASDAIVGKVGYSTLAETYYAGVPFGYIQRPTFRESATLAAFIRAYMPGLELPAENFEHGHWLSHLHPLLALPRRDRHEPNGAEQVAEYIESILPHPPPPLLSAKSGAQKRGE